MQSAVLRDKSLSLSSKIPLLPDTKINPLVRKIPQSEVCLKAGEQPIGEGTFGVCYKARYSHFDVVVKKLKKGSNERLLTHEANMLITCSTKYTPYLFGITLQQGYLIMSSHGSSGTLATVLDKHDDDHKAASWVQFVLHVAEGVRAIHSKNVAHNDIKADNVLLDATDGSYFPIIADFGKACLLKDGQKLTVRAERQEMHMKKYPHLAPDLVNGTTRQSTSTDIYSLGYVGVCIEKCMGVHQLSRINCSATQSNTRDRPDINTLILKLQETLQCAVTF